MPLFKILTADIKVGNYHNETAVIAVAEMELGKCIIRHSGLSVPITVMAQSITIEIEQARGELSQGRISAYGVDWTLAEAEGICSVTLDLKKWSVPLLILSNEESNCGLSLEWLEERPEVFHLPTFDEGDSE